MVSRKANTAERIVIYFSREDGCWVAHSLQMDQIGTGDRIVDALADVLNAIRLVQEEASKDNSLAVRRNAPRQIWDRAKKAKKLPGEIYEVAHKMVHGEWPEDWNPPEPKDSDQMFKTETQESACAEV